MPDRTAEVPTKAEFDALVARVTATEADVAELEQRVTVLEGSSVQPTPSPDGTVVDSERGEIIDSRLRSFGLRGSPDNFHIEIDGQISAYTQYVVRLEAHGGVCYQVNQDNNWWYMPGSAWIEVNDPNAPPSELPGPPYNGLVDFGVQGKTLHATLFGMGAGSLENDDYLQATDPLVVSQHGVIRPRCFRLHSQHRMAEKVARGDRTAFDRWLAASAEFLAPDAMVVVGVGPVFDDRSLSPEEHGRNAAALARAFIDAGHEVHHWEVGNESEGLGADLYTDIFIACADALHAVNPDYSVGGPVAMWWGSIDLSTFCSRAGSRIGSVIFHSYCVENDSLIYSQALAWEDARRAREMMRSNGIPDSVPIRVLEYNMNGADHGGLWGMPAQTDHRGALYFALVLQSMHECDVLVDAAACWDSIGDSYFGQIGPAPDYNNHHITPSGHYLRIAGEHLHGAQVQASAELPDFRVLCVVRGSEFTLQCVNYGESAQSFNPEWQGTTAAKFVRRFDVGRDYPEGSEMGAALPIVVPAQGIVLITGTLQ